MNVLELFYTHIDYHVTFKSKELSFLNEMENVSFEVRCSKIKVV